MYAFSFLFPPDKIEEAQKELNGAEVSKKGKKKPALCGLHSFRDAHMDLSELKPFLRKLVLMCVNLGLSPHCFSPTHTLMLGMCKTDAVPLRALLYPAVW